MTRIRRMICLLVLPLTIALFSTGCEDSGGGSSAPVGPDLRGEWSGTYFTTDGLEGEAITATVSQNGNAVTIVTSRSGNTAGRFTGTITEDGYLALTDAADGETWTTPFGLATENSIAIYDLLIERVPVGGSYPYAVVELSR